jgi:beta-glucanase (GH16 family)
MSKNNNNLIDDFNNLNLKYWNVIESGNNPNNELQYYKYSNISINNGNLMITAKKEFDNGYSYTSGMINTKGKFEFQYGKIIFKAKAVLGNGLFPAIWLLPADENRYPEVDLVEILGEKSDQIWVAVHYLDNGIKKSDFTKNIVHTNYFTYEFMWAKDKIECYINNVLVYKTEENIPQEKMYIIINLAVGGNWPADVDDNLLPSSFLIDYIVIIPEA